MSVPMLYVLITYSCQHDILIPTYIGMSSLYQVLNYVEDSKSVPIWYHVPIRYHYKFDANIVGRF